LQRTVLPSGTFYEQHALEGKEGKKRTSVKIVYTRGNIAYKCTVFFFIDVTNNIAAYIVGMCGKQFNKVNSTCQ